MGEDDEFYDNGTYTPIPAGLKPRLRDFISENMPNKPKIKSAMFKATHFSLGLNASQSFMDCCTSDWNDIRESLDTFAPHPFDNYSFSFWMGTGISMIETFILVGQGDAGEMRVGMMLMHSDQDLPVDDILELVPRSALTSMMASMEKFDGDVPPELRKGVERINAGWLFTDVFKLLLARPGVTMINQGSARRTGLSKGGKRVSYYSSSDITIDLDKARKIRTDHRTGHGKSPANYGYRAHCCHDAKGRAKGCEHYWIEIGGRHDEDEVWHPDPENGRGNATWECYHCGGRRWQRRAGRRGDGGLGFIKQTYTVKDGEDDIVPA